MAPPECRLGRKERPSAVNISVIKILFLNQSLGARPQSNRLSLAGLIPIASQVCTPPNMVLRGEGCFLPDLTWFPESPSQRTNRLQRQ